MASKLALYNSALRLNGEAALSALTDAVEPRRVLDEVYAGALLYCLEQGYWNFAIRAIEASSVPSIEPTFNYSYAFTKPDDWLRTAGVWSDANESAALIEYAFEQGYYYANVDPIWIRYVSSDNEYGMDLGKWTQTFTKYVEAHLAAEICERLSDNTSKSQELRELEERRLRDAKSKDAMDGPARFPPLGAWASSRGGGIRRSVWARGRWR